MGRPLIIALVGTDGSGKTTHARWLAEWLTARGVPADYHQNPGGRPTLGRLARRFGRADGIDLLGRHLYLAVEITIRWGAIARSLLRSRRDRRVAVMDRYSYCQYAVMQVRGDRGRRLARALFSPFPRPDLVCFLAVTPEVAQQRVHKRGTDSEELTYLRAFDLAYRALPESAGFTHIDADCDSDRVKAALSEAAMRTITGAPR